MLISRNILFFTAIFFLQFLCYSCCNERKGIEKGCEDNKAINNSFFKDTLNMDDSETLLNMMKIEAVIIGDATWMQENLSVTTFRNGDIISQAKTNEEWQKAAQDGYPVWCFYENRENNEGKYGKLYNWYAVNDARGLAPEGWKIPSEKDWLILINKFGGITTELVELMSIDGWEEGYGGNNISGFRAYPGGGRFWNGEFKGEKYSAYFWSSTSSSHEGLKAVSFSLSNPLSMISSFNKGYGFSIRCIMDDEYNRN